jgi:predicted amidophosphoribosyltransferase
MRKKRNVERKNDEIIGSGATINEIALKIKAKGIAKEITGLAISGSYKGFDVISEL